MELKKRFFFLFICVFSIWFGQTGLNALPLRIASYNIWNPLFEEKYSGKSNWQQRLPFVVNAILDAESDLVCLQEVGKEEFFNLLEEPRIRKKYIAFYFSHAASQLGQREGRDGLALFYDPEQVALLQLVQSEDGSRPTHRRDYYADFTLKQKKQDDKRIKPIHFRLSSTHLDSGKELAIGNRQLAKLVEDVTNKDMNGIDFVVVCGDFNEGESEQERPRAAIMNEAGFITDGSLAPTRPEELDVRHKGHVDWIYVKPLSSSPLFLSPMPTVGDSKASDHKLIRTDISI